MALNEGRDGIVLTRRERSLARKSTVMPEEVRGRLGAGHVSLVIVTKA
jgi:hypothetical protein